MWNSDSAGDVQLAARLATSKLRPISEQGNDLFPNMRAVNWDAAHASRRLTSRPWATDPYLMSTLKLFVLKVKRKKGERPLQQFHGDDKSRRKLKQYEPYV